MTDEELDARQEAREDADDVEQLQEHNAEHDSEQAPVEGCYFCEQEVEEERAA